MLSSRDGRFSLFPAGRNPKKGDAICSFSLFSSALSLTKYFTCKWCFLFVFKKKERTSFVPAAELLEELAHLTSNYRVFTVYTRQWQVKAQGHSLGEPATPGLNDRPTSLLETLQVLPSPAKVTFRILRRGGGWGLRGGNPTGPNETKPPCDAPCCFSTMFSAVVLSQVLCRTCRNVQTPCCPHSAAGAGTLPGSFVSFITLGAKFKLLQPGPAQLSGLTLCLHPHLLSALQPASRAAGLAALSFPGAWPSPRPLFSRCVPGEVLWASPPPAPAGTGPAS